MEKFKLFFISEHNSTQDMEFVECLYICMSACIVWPYMMRKGKWPYVSLISTCVL